METVPTPSITKEDVLALVVTVLTALSAFNFDITDAQKAALVGLAGTVYVFGQLAAGAWRRGKRAQAHATIVSAQAMQVDAIAAPFAAGTKMSEAEIADAPPTSR